MPHPAAGDRYADQGRRRRAPPVLAREQLDALRRQQLRILHRSELLAYVLAARESGVTMGDALAELVDDIMTAARDLRTALQVLRA